MNCNNIMMIVGPTTTGKTEIAHRISLKVGGEMINADRCYLYRGFNYSTDLSDTLSDASVPKHLYQVLDPLDQLLSVDEYVQRVSEIVPAIIARAHIPLVEGCSASYIKALSEKYTSQGYNVNMFGIRWPSGFDLEGRMRLRLDLVFDRMTEEVDAALANGYGAGYVMTCSVHFAHLIDYSRGDISRHTAKDRIISSGMQAAQVSLQKFLKIPDVLWIEHEPGRLEHTVGNILAYLHQSG